jgi:hypothetical protein
VVLITQHSRTIQDRNPTPATSCNSSATPGVALTVLVPNAPRDEQGNAILGLDANDTTYRADGSGGVSWCRRRGRYVHAFNTDSSPRLCQRLSQPDPGAYQRSLRVDPAPRFGTARQLGVEPQPLRRRSDDGVLAQAFLQAMVEETLEQLL